MPKKKKTAQILKDQCQVLLDTLSEYNCDYRSIMRDLDYIQQASIQGYDTEVSHARDGVVTVNEKHPEVALRALLAKMKLIQDIDKYQQDVEDDVDYSININIVPLEDLVK